MEHISEAGIALLLFVVGLELSFAKVRDVGRVSVLAGLGQVLFTANAGLPTIAISSCMILYSHPLLRAVRRTGLLRLFRATKKTDEPRATPARRRHVIVVGMNTLGRLLV